MGLSHSPSIVTSGLILYLDAANKKSYPGSGSTWYDLSGNGNNGTLTNNPTFTNNYRGSFYFDNVDDYVQLNGINWETLASSRNFTFMFGALKTKYGVSGNNSGDSYLMLGSSNGYNTGWRIIESSNGTPGTDFTGSQVYTFGSPAISPSVTVTDTSNRFAICAFSQLGSAVTGFLNNNIATATFETYVAGSNVGRIGQSNHGVGTFGGYISFIMAYSRALSAIEIQQNFNALRGRYGI